MAKYLISTSETYRVDTEMEAQNLINAAKEDQLGTLIKYTDTYKEIKSKGEVVEVYYRVILTRNFNDEKEPEDYVDIIYAGRDHTFEPDSNEN